MIDATNRASEQLRGLLERQSRERRELVEALVAEEDSEAAEIRGEFNQNAGTAIAEALEDVERQIQRDLKADTLRAAVITELPGWMARNLPYLDDDDILAGRKSVLVCIPRREANGHYRERKALAVIDVSKQVFPGGNRG